MAVYQDNAAGVTSSIGTDDYLVTGGIDQYGPMIGVLTDGAVYPYYIAFIDVTDGADYETGQGTWDSGSNTLARTTIETSSNSGNAVNWGVGNKALWIVQDASLATDMEQMRNGSTKFYLTSTQAANIAASKTKTDLITVTTPANLDTMQAEIAAITTGITYRGNWDASTGVFPGGGAGHAGDYWYCNVSGVVDTVSFEAGDSIIALVANASISTFSGNWAKQDSFDSVQSVAGLVGTITSDGLKEAMSLYTPFPDKPLGDPIFIVLTGQSNAVGIYPNPIIDMPANSEVYDWHPDNGTQNTGACSFYAANPVRVLSPVYNNSNMITGMRGAWTDASVPAWIGTPLGNIGWSLANSIQQTTGRRVYLLSVAWSGKAITSWANGVDCEAQLATQVPLALAEIAAAFPSANVTAPDMVVWMQGETDLSNGRTPAQYASDWLTFKSLVEGKWAIAGVTQWTICDIAQGNYTSTYWPAFNRIIAETAQDVQFVSSVGVEYLFDVAYHYTGTGLSDMGARCSAPALAGPVSKPLTSREAALLSWRYGAATSDTPNGASAVGFNFNTSVALNNATAKLLSVNNNGVEKFAIGSTGVSLTSDVADSSSARAFTLDTTNSLADAAAELVIVKNAGTVLFSIEQDGSINAGGDQGFGTTHFSTNFFNNIYFNRACIYGANTTSFTTSQADGASVVGFKYITLAYTTAGAKLASWFNDTAEKVYFTKDGLVNAAGGVTTGGTITANSGLVLTGTLSGAGTIATSGAIGTSASMTATNFTAASGTVSAQFVTATSNYAGREADSATAIGHLFNTSSYTTTGAKLAAWQNNGTEKVAITKDGYITGKSPGAGAGTVTIQPSDDATTTITFSQIFGLTFITSNGTQVMTHSTNIADAAGTAFAFNNTVALTGTGTTKLLLEVKNNNVSKFIVNHLGSPGFWGVTPVGTQPTAGSGGTSGWTSVGGSAVLSNSTWTGGTGSTAYTVHDLVFALKKAGIIVT
jgi:hypothetical protein